MASLFVKKSLLLTALTFVIFDNGQIVLSETKHRCSLLWEPFSSGALIPEVALEAQKSQLYVIRGRLEEKLLVGYYDPAEERAFISDISNPDSNSSVHTLMTFDILTNPYNCETNWLDKRHEDASKFAVPCSDDLGSLVGRAQGNTSLPNGDSLFSGHINRVQDKIFIPQVNSTLQRSDYFILTSFTADVELSLGDFKFAEDVFGGPSSIIGMDEIMNDSPAEIQQTVTHSRSLSSRMQFSSRVSFTVAKTTNVKSGWDIGLAANSRKESQYDATTTTNDTSFEREETSVFRVARTVSVPPFSSVQACTMMQIRENFATTWVAEATFSAAGVQPQSIVDWLNTEEGWKDQIFQIKNDIVTTEISGDFQGTFAVNSKFFVTSSGCTETAKFLAKQKHSTKLLDWKEEYATILKIMKSLR